MELTTKYTLTGNAFEGVITFTFHNDGYLIGFEIEGAELSEKQRNWLYPRLPFEEKNIAFFKNLKEFKVKKGVPKLNFEAFWSAYGKKQKRTVAEKLWKKLSKRDKMAAMQSIGRYNNWLNRNAGIAKQLPDTYLRQKRWLDDFNQ